jgi:hypothetical protein
MAVWPLEASCTARVICGRASFHAPLLHIFIERLTRSADVGPRLAENLETQLLTLPKPDHMARVIRKVVASVGVGEDGEVAAVEN